MNRDLAEITSPIRLGGRKILARGLLRAQLSAGRAVLWSKNRQKYFILPGDYVGSMNAQFGCYEKEEIDVLRWVLTTCCSDIQINQGAMLDVGAHLGNYSIELGRSFKKVVAVEASPVLSKVASANLLWNGLQPPHSELVDKAVSDQAGYVQFEHNQAGNLGGSKITSADTVNVHSFRVPTISLSEVAAIATSFTDRIVLIKMDVEGHEIAALQSGADIIATHQPILQIEVSPENLAPFQQLMEQLLPGNKIYVVSHHPSINESRWRLVQRFMTRKLFYRLLPIQNVNTQKRLRALIVLPRWAQGKFPSVNGG